MRRTLKKLPYSFYRRDTVLVARELLGQLLCHETKEGLCSGRIVEVEAYLGETDAASHAYRGRTQRTEKMFEPGGCAYVYFTYGVHYCVNVVTESRGFARAVLIRALEPVDGIALMKKRRAREQIAELCSGPGKLTQALGIDSRLNGADLKKSELYIVRGEKISPENILTSARIGISKAMDEALRFFVRENLHVSKTKLKAISF